MGEMRYAPKKLEGYTAYGTQAQMGGKLVLKEEIIFAVLDVTQRRMVVGQRRFGQPTGPIFKGPIGCLEIQVTNQQPTLHNTPEQQLSDLHRAGSLVSRLRLSNKLSSPTGSSVRLTPWCIQPVGFRSGRVIFQRFYFVLCAILVLDGFTCGAGRLYKLATSLPQPDFLRTAAKYMNERVL